MSVFDTPRPNDATRRYESVIETAIARKNNRRKLAEQKKEAESINRITSATLENSKPEPSFNYELSRRETQQTLRNATRKLATLESRLVKEGYPKCFNNAIFQIVFEAFWADEAIKEKTLPDMNAVYENVLSLLDSLDIKPVPESKQNMFIRNVKEVVTETCNKAAKRIATDAYCCKDGKAPEDIDEIVFSLNSDESQDMDNNLAELSPEDMSILVKNKVLQVVQDEQLAGQKKAEVFKEIDDAVQLTKDEAKADEESLPPEEGGENPPEEITPAGTTAESVSYLEAVTTAKKRKMHRHIGDSVFECLMMGATKNVTLEAAYTVKNANKSDVMDAAFMEAMMNYTVLETLQTIGLYDFSHEDIRKISESYYKS